MAEEGPASSGVGEAASLVWYPRSDPTIVASIQYTCPHCHKPFSRPRDLNRHEKNHTRPFKCNKCPGRFPSSKDLERHIANCHCRQIRYHCPIKQCKESVYYMHVIDRGNRGFHRKDNWQRHMRNAHSMGRKILQEIEKAGIPMARKAGKVWMEVAKTIAGERGLGESVTC